VFDAHTLRHWKGAVGEFHKVFETRLSVGALSRNGKLAVQLAKEFMSENIESGSSRITPEAIIMKTMRQ
jgi:hypothetical protein